MVGDCVPGQSSTWSDTLFWTYRNTLSDKTWNQTFKKLNWRVLFKRPDFHHKKVVILIMGWKRVSLWSRELAFFFCEMWNQIFIHVNLIIFFQWNLKSQLNFCGLWSSPVMRAVLGLYLVPGNDKFLKISWGFASWTATKVLPWTHRGLIAPHTPIWVQHDNHSIPHWFHLIKMRKPSKHLRESWKTSALYHPLIMIQWILEKPVKPWS